MYSFVSSLLIPNICLRNFIISCSTRDSSIDQDIITFINGESLQASRNRLLTSEAAKLPLQRNAHVDFVRFGSQEQIRCRDSKFDPVRGGRPVSLRRIVCLQALLRVTRCRIEFQSCDQCIA